MKSISRQSATKRLIVSASILAFFLISSIFAERASTQGPVANGKIAFEGQTSEIVVMNPDGSNQTTLTGGYEPSYSPDGTKIAFVKSVAPNTSRLYVMNADGSNQVQLTNGPNEDEYPGWSPDGTKIVFQSSRDDPSGQNSEIYVMNANGSNQVRLTHDAVNDGEPSYSPDGSKIVFHSNRTGHLHVFVMNADGSSQTQLSTSSPGKPDEGEAAWSPDGSKIAHLRGDVSNEASFEIFVMNADGSNPVALTNNGFADEEPTWSPDGAKLAFVDFSTGLNRGSIFTMGANGSNQVQLTDDVAAVGKMSWQSVWTQGSVSNGKIAFERPSSRVVVMNPDGSNQTTITDGYEPSYSPDGTKIAFVRSVAPNTSRLYVMNADGSNQVQLTNGPNEDEYPGWSPDGTKIVFQSSRDDPSGQNIEIYVMNANGSNQIRLTNDAGIDGEPSYSPDGTKIVFHSNRTGQLHVFVMNADGSSQTQLSTSSPGTTGEGEAAWSPDGSKIAHLRGDVSNEASFEIFVMNADGSNPVALTNNAVADEEPTWSPDGTKLAFVSFSTDPNLNAGSIFTMGANGSNQVQLTGDVAATGKMSWQSVAATPTPTVQLSSSTYSVSENGPDATVMVTRAGDTSGASTVDYATSDTAGANNCNVLNTGVASSRCDYETTMGTLSFAAGETTKTISIPIVDDAYAEGNESFTVTLSNASGASLGSPSTATVTITDNESTTGANPIDQAGFFVRLHYVDFLNREPDAGGLGFWSNQITECQQPGATCSAEVRRINVSAAFFLSIEFQETGYLVYRFYKAAYGNVPGLPVPVRFNEFLPDTQQIGRGVVVGQTGWEQVLENNKQALATEFVTRSRFSSVYPTTQTPAQFVDALFANAGVTPSTTDRTAAINEFGSVTDTANPVARGRALRRVAQNSALAQQEFNKAFVLMQYFGYLRRNPNDPPELGLNFDGYNFWLGKLNQFNGNFVTAEMVKAFIVSGEYKGRFGP